MFCDTSCQTRRNFQQGANIEQTRRDRMDRQFSLRRQGRKECLDNRRRQLKRRKTSSNKVNSFGGPLAYPNTVNWSQSSSQPDILSKNLSKTPSSSTSSSTSPSSSFSLATSHSDKDSSCPRFVSIKDLIFASVQLIKSKGFENISRGMQDLRLLVSKDDAKPPVAFLLQTGVVPKVIQCLNPTNLDCYHMNLTMQQIETLQKDSAWILANLASEDNTACVSICAGYGMIDALSQCLQSTSNTEVETQCFWALGNIAGDIAQHRSYLVEIGVIEHVVKNWKRYEVCVKWEVMCLLRNLFRTEGKKSDGAGQKKQVLNDFERLFCVQSGASDKCDENTIAELRQVVEKQLNQIEDQTEDWEPLLPVLDLVHKVLSEYLEEMCSDFAKDPCVRCHTVKVKNCKKEDCPRGMRRYILVEAMLLLEFLGNTAESLQELRKDDENEYFEDLLEVRVRCECARGTEENDDDDEDHELCCYRSRLLNKLVLVLQFEAEQYEEMLEKQIEFLDEKEPDLWRLTPRQHEKAMRWVDIQLCQPILKFLSMIVTGETSLRLTQCLLRAEFLNVLNPFLHCSKTRSVVLFSLSNIMAGPEGHIAAVVENMNLVNYIVECSKKGSKRERIESACCMCNAIIGADETLLEQLITPEIIKSLLPLLESNTESYIMTFASTLNNVMKRFPEGSDLRGIRDFLESIGCLEKLEEIQANVLFSEELFDHIEDFISHYFREDEVDLGGVNKLSSEMFEPQTNENKHFVFGVTKNNEDILTTIQKMNGSDDKVKYSF